MQGLVTNSEVLGRQRCPKPPRREDRHRYEQRDCSDHDKVPNGADAPGRQWQQKIHGPIVASILIGSIWGLWHAPLYLSGVYSGGLQAMIGRVFWTIPLAFLFTWVYNHTRGSLLLSVLLHTSVNLQGDISSLVLSALSG